MEEFLHLTVITKSTAVIFSAEKLKRTFALQKYFIFFSAKNGSVWGYFNILFTNKLVSFDQLGPGWFYSASGMTNSVSGFALFVCSDQSLPILGSFIVGLLFQICSILIACMTSPV